MITISDDELRYCTKKELENMVWFYSLEPNNKQALIMRKQCEQELVNRKAKIKAQKTKL